MEVWSCFYEIQEQDVFELVDSILNNMERISTKKKNENHLLSSVFKRLR